MVKRRKKNTRKSGSSKGFKTKALGSKYHLATTFCFTGFIDKKFLARKYFTINSIAKENRLGQITSAKRYTRSYIEEKCFSRSDWATIKYCCQDSLR